jgi:hypothetical protein
LDRLDYLIVQNGFTGVLKMLQELNETIYLAKAILLVVVDGDTLSLQEQSLLKKELLGVEARHHIELEKDLLDIMKFVKKQNESGRSPAHKDVSSFFKITRPTAIKRLNLLKTKGLVVDSRRGRFKTLELTERGKEIL